MDLLEMSNSREDSPDWLRAFQAPEHSVLTLSSDSEDSIKHSSLKDDTADVKKDAELDESTNIGRDDDQKNVSSKLSPKSELTKSMKKKTSRKRLQVEGTSTKRRKTTNFNKKTGKEDITKTEEELSENQIEVHACIQSLMNRSKASIWTLSSDSEADAISGSGVDKPYASNLNEKEMDDMKLSDNKDYVPEVAPERKSPTKKINADNTLTDEKKMEEKGDLVEVHQAERASEKHVQSCVRIFIIPVSSSMLPLVIPDRVQRSKVLVECEGGSIDLSGDVGAVGRVIVSGNPTGDREMLLDLKGTIYRTTIVPSMTFCVVCSSLFPSSHLYYMYLYVSVGPSEAKIEAITNDFIQLKPQSNVYDAETMVEGSLNGFSFDSEDEADKVPKGDKNEGAEEHTNEKAKAKSVRKSAALQKKGKATGGKQVRKRKPTASKKGGKAKK
ncbi:hypothetical protein V2J09_021047 [Rumex salicifolius]